MEIEKGKEKGGGSKSSLTYGAYLKVKELVSLQKTLSSPTAHDELLFIVIHQVYELWFKLLNFETTALITSLGAGDINRSLKILSRLDEIFRVLTQQIEVLETMTPMEFNQFREHLNPASGFQSMQFREFEILAGADVADYEKFLTFEPEWKSILDQRSAQPNLRGALFELFRKRGLIPSVYPEAIEAAILKIYTEPTLVDLQSVCECLIKLDEQVSLWRFRHVQMVERMIGMKPGTGGSLGVPYLRGTLKKRFFPELWEARTGMGT